jgi:MFS family permease
MAATPQHQVAVAAEHTSPAPSATGGKWLLALTSLGALMVTLDALVVASAFSTIRRELHASIDQLQWTANAYTLSVAMMLMVASVLGDRWGRRRMFVAGLLVFTAASAVCAVSPTIGALVAARTVQGAGAAFIMPMAMGLLVAGFPPERRGWATGIFAGITGLGVLAGFGVSLALPAAQAAVTGAVPAQAAGMAGGIYSMMRQTGGAVGVAVLTAVFTSVGGYADFPRSMQRVLEVSAALSLAGGIAAIFIAARRSNRPTASSDSTPRVSRRTPRNDFLGLGQDA